MSTIQESPINRVESGIIASERAVDTNVSSSPAEVRQEAADKASTVTSVAKDAADAAQSKGTYNSQIGDISTNFHAQASAMTDHAVTEGQKDLENAKVTGASYVDQAKSLASNALATAQAYVDAGQAKVAPSGSQAGVVNTIQSTASYAMEATKNALASAQETLQPHFENAKAAAQPHIDAASQAATPYIQSAKDAVQPRVDAVTSMAQPYVDAASAKLGDVKGISREPKDANTVV